MFVGEPKLRMIDVIGVTKRFGGKRDVLALDNVSVTIPKGELVSVVGASGSGKSTLLNLIGGLDRPSSGDIRVDGESLAGISDDALTMVRREKIGFIFQFFHLLPTLTCLENVGLPLHLRRWPRKKVEERARELLEVVQLGHRLTHLPEELSGGERQRVAIARALAVFRRSCWPMNRPATSIRRPARTFWRCRPAIPKHGATVVVVTHDPRSRKRANARSRFATVTS